ncbi:MAG: hypothetical protein IKC52_04580 [Clostridia bacterium]|nr:hypothetical protein [Clostridia bacterium]
MNITKSLLYLLLLYAVLDRDKKLSLTNGLVIAFVILLLNCYINNRSCNSVASANSSCNGFSFLNGF